jgi:hypothetical protein
MCMFAITAYLTWGNSKHNNADVILKGNLRLNAGRRGGPRQDPYTKPSPCGLKSTYLV